MENQRKKTLLLLAIAVILIVVLLIFSFTIFFGNKQIQFPSGSLIASPTPVQSGNSESQRGKLTPLQTTEIGKTTQQEIENRAEIISKRQEGNVTIYTTTSKEPGDPDEIRTKDGVVIFERTTTETAAAPIPETSKIIAQYGTPEETIDRVGEGFYITAYLYPTKGFVLFGNRYTDSVYEVQRFTPMSRSEYKRIYGESLAPAPEMPRDYVGAP